MADEIVQSKVEVNTKEVEESLEGLKKRLDVVKKSVGDLNKEGEKTSKLKTLYKDASNAVAILGDKFGYTSKQAKEAAKVAAALYEKIEVNQKIIQSYDPGKQFALISGSLKGIATGFELATGAQALFGDASEKTKEKLVKLQAAMNLAHGLGELDNAKKDFEALGLKIKGTTIYQEANNAVTKISTFLFKALGIETKTAAVSVGQVGTNSKTTAEGMEVMNVATKTTSLGFKTLKTAIAATGIGLLVIAIVALIANFESIKKWIMNLLGPFKFLADAVGSLVTWFTDLIGVTSEAERQEKKRQETYKAAASKTKIVNEQLEREIKLMEAQGVKQDIIDEKRKESIKNELRDLKLAANERGMLYGDQAKKYKDLQNELSIIDAESNERSKEEKKKTAEDSKRKAKERAQEAKRIKDEKDKQIAEAYKEKLELIKDDKKEKLVQLKDELKFYDNYWKQLGLKYSEYLKQKRDLTKQIAEEEKDITIRNTKAIDEIAILKASNDKQRLDAEQQQLKNNYLIQIQDKTKTFDELRALEYQYIADSKTLQDNYDKEVKAKEDQKRQDSVQIKQETIDNNIAELDLKKNAIDMEIGWVKDKFNKLKEIEDGYYLEKKTKIDTQYQDDLITFKDNKDKLLQIAREHEIAIQQLDQEHLAAKKDIHEKEAASHVALADAIGSSMGALAEVAGKNTATGKALAIAEATINTFKAGLQIFAAQMPGPPPVALAIKIVSMVAAIATGFKTIKSIVSTKVPGQGGGGGSATAPAAPSVPTIPQNVFSAPQLFGIGGQRIEDVKTLKDQKVIVVGYDVTRQQNRTDQVRKASVQGG